jgi:hypothetical protein
MTEYKQKHNQVVDTIKQLVNPNQQAKDFLVALFFLTLKTKRKCKIISQFKIKKIKYFEDSLKQTNAPAKADAVNFFTQAVQKKQQETQQNQFHQAGLSNFVQPLMQNPMQPSFLQTQNLQPINQQNQFFQNLKQQQPPSMPPQINLSTAFPSTIPNLFNQLVNKPLETKSPQSSLNSPPSFFPLVANSNPTQNGIFGNNTTNTVNFIGGGIQANSQVENVNFGSVPFYSSPNELSEQDKKEFDSSHFSLGKIPRNPPTQNMC